MEFKDYYATLGVAKTATDKDIKQAYRKLARKHPPGRQPGRQDGRVALQVHQRGLRGARRPGQAPQVRRTGRQLAPVRAGAAQGRPGALRRRRVERERRRRPGRLPDDDRRRDAADVRRSGPVLGLLPRVLRRRRRPSPRRRPRRQGRAARARRGPGRRAGPGADARGGVPRRDAPALRSSTTDTPAAWTSGSPRA